jgi:hypothetical protein
LYVIVVLAAAVIGVLAGQQIRFVASIPNMAAMFAWLLAAAAWGLVVVIGVVGMVLLALHRLADGVGTLGAAGALAVGVLAGQATGSEWRYPVETSARVEVELAAPISETFSGIGICRTIDNGDLIDAVQASAIVRVGRDQCHSSCGWRKPRVLSTGSN